MAYKITKAVNDMQNKHIKITIHAGAHKTATTHLQNRLLENENLFAKGGCSYLGPEKIREQNIIKTHFQLRVAIHLHMK